MKRFLSTTTILICTSFSLNAPASAQDSMNDYAANLYMQTFPNTNAEQAMEIMGAERKIELNKVRSCIENLPGYAGVEIRHIPKYRVIAKFKRKPNKKLRSCTHNRKLFKAVGAARSLDELEDARELAAETLQNAGIEFESTISLKKNRVTIDLLEGDLKVAKKELKKIYLPKSKNNKFKHTPRAFAFNIVTGFGAVTSATRESNETLTSKKIFLDGSKGLSTCSSGFAVRSTEAGNNTIGMTTANHCGREVRFGGESGRIQNGLGLNDNLCSWAPGIQKTTDLQWYSRDGDDYEPRLEIVEPGFREVIEVETYIKSAEITKGSDLFPELTEGFGLFTEVEDFPPVFPGDLVCVSGQTYGTIKESPARSGIRGGATQLFTAANGEISTCTTDVFTSDVKKIESFVSPRVVCGTFDKLISRHEAVAIIPQATRLNEFTQGGDSGGAVFGFGLVPGGFFFDRIGLAALGSVRGHSSITPGVLRYTPIEGFDDLDIEVLTIHNK